MIAMNSIIALCARRFSASIILGRCRFSRRWAIVDVSPVRGAVLFDPNCSLVRPTSLRASTVWVGLCERHRRTLTASVFRKSVQARAFGLSMKPFVGFHPACAGWLAAAVLHAQTIDCEAAQSNPRAPNLGDLELFLRIGADLRVNARQRLPIQAYVKLVLTVRVKAARSAFMANKAGPALRSVFFIQTCQVPHGYRRR